MSIIRVSDRPRRFGATWARLRGLDTTAKIAKSSEDSRERLNCHPGTLADHGSDRRVPGLRAQRGSLEGYIVFEGLIRVRLRVGLSPIYGRIDDFLKRLSRKVFVFELIVDHLGVRDI